MLKYITWVCNEDVAQLEIEAIPAQLTRRNDLWVHFALSMRPRRELFTSGLERKINTAEILAKQTTSGLGRSMVEKTILVGDLQRPSRVVIDPHTIDQPLLQDFLLYWRHRCKGNDVPQYSDFSPRDFTKHLGSIVVTDALHGHTDFRYRVVGSRVTRYFLSDATGKTIRQEFGGELGKFLNDLNRRACSEKIPIRLTGPAAIVGDVLFPDYDTLYLPWANGEYVNKVVSVFVFDPESLVARSVEPEALPASYSSLKVSSADDLIR